MYKCEKCGMEYPDSVKLPIRCLCKAGKTNLYEVEIVSKSQNNQEPTFNINIPQFQYSDLWEELHTYKWISSEETKKWYILWINKLPCGTCKQHWELLIKDFPPDFSSKQAFFEWGVAAHNKVNKRLGKQEITLEEATLLWLRS